MKMLTPTLQTSSAHEHDPAVAATALPISSKGVNINHLNEAQAVWTVNKIMGLSYSGDEKDLLRRLASMEAEDEERAKAHDFQHND